MVYDDQFAVSGNVFEYSDFPVRELGRINHEVEFDLPVFCLGREPEASVLDRSPVFVDHHRIDLPDDHVTVLVFHSISVLIPVCRCDFTGKDVLFADLKVFIGERILEDPAVRGKGVLDACHRVDRFSPPIGDIDRLVVIMQVSVYGDLFSVIFYRFTDDELLAGKVRRVDFKADRDRAADDFAAVPGRGEQDFAVLDLCCSVAVRVHAYDLGRHGYCAAPVLTLFLYLDCPGDRVLPVRDQAGVGDVIEDHFILVRQHGLFFRPLRGRVCGHIGYGHGLAGVADLPVFRYDFAVADELLECHDGSALEACRIELESNFDRAALFFSRELCRGCNRPAVTLKRFTCCLVHQRAVHSVPVADSDVIVTYRIDQLNVGIRGSELLAELRVLKERADLREVDRLVFIVQVRVDEDFLVLVSDRLERYSAPALKRGGIERELKDHAAVRFVRRERLFCRHLLTANSKRLVRRFVHKDAADFVFLACKEVFVDDFVPDRYALCDPCRMAAGLGVLSGRPAVGELDRLVLVLDVGVDEYVCAFILHCLKYDSAFASHPGPVEREGHRVGAVRLGRGEPLRDSDLFSAGNDRLACRLVHKFPCNGIFLAGDEVVVLDRVADRDALVRVGDVVACLGICGRSLAARRIYGLLRITDLLVLRDDFAAAGQFLVRHERLAVKSLRVEREGHIDSPAFFFSREGGRCRHLLAAGLKGLARRLVHEDAVDGVLVSHCDVAVAYGVDQCDGAAREHDLLFRRAVAQLRPYLREMDRLVLIA